MAENEVREIKRPKNVEFNLVEGDKNVAIFSISPYERGFSTTVGNSLRRVLLSTIEGHAVSSIYFNQVNNEFKEIDGLVENTTDIILNLKRLSIGLADENLASRKLSFDIKGKRDFYAKDFQVDDEIIIGNPDLLIFSATDKADFTFDVTVTKGWGYIPSEEIELMLERKGEIAIDANYSPVKQATFRVESLDPSVGRCLENLIFEVHTRGTKSPEQCLRVAAAILKETYECFCVMREESYMTVVNIREKEEFKNDEIFSQNIYHGGFTVRTCFFLKINDILEFGQLVSRSEKDILDKPYANEVIVEDIKEKLSKKNLTLGMRDINYVDTSI